MTDYSTVFKDTVTSEEIALAIRNDYSNWCSGLYSARTRVTAVGRENLHIIPIKRRPCVYHKTDALKIAEYIINYISNKSYTPVPSTDTEGLTLPIEIELRKRCDNTGCSREQYISKALEFYFKTHPYEGKTHQELVELLEQRDSEREDIFS